MYNRYIPQPDGSFHRRQYPDHSIHPSVSADAGSRKIPCQPETKSCSQTTATPSPQQPACCRCQSCKRRNAPGDTQQINIGSFLKNLLPKGLDAGDLMVILLLLLMSSDCSDDQNSTLLTLALYLFL